jgi:uncharacterized membrane protein YbhN (UPF0104 family)
MKQHLKPMLAVMLLVVTASVFTWYLRNHPELIRQLKDVNPLTLLLLIVCYSVWFLALAVVLQISLRMYNKQMSAQENLLLSAYSSLINFFGPGQSGPGLRGIYLKKKYNLRIKDYIFATLMYYACYAVISAFMMFVGSRPWWQTCSLVVLAASASALVLRWYSKKSHIAERPAFLKYGGWMLGVTGIQLTTQAIIYAIEIHAVSNHVSLGQIISYTGAANFALFAALTPGAIGIREAFLIFTQNLHHISSSVIVAANVIDRAAYIVFLGILFVFVFGMHAGKKFKFRQSTQDTPDSDATRK